MKICDSELFLIFFFAMVKFMEINGEANEVSVLNGNNQYCF